MRKYRYKAHRGDRQPVYADGKTRRIISAPNEMWIPQYRAGESEHRWESIGRPTTKVIAMGIIGIKGDQI